MEKTEYPVQYENKSVGEKYEFLTNQILQAKESSAVTKPWEVTYFSRFLYETYPPPAIIPLIEKKKLREKSEIEKKHQFSDFMSLLNQLRINNKISAEQLRDCRKQWEENPQDREILCDRLLSLRN